MNNRRRVVGRMAWGALWALLGVALAGGLFMLLMLPLAPGVDRLHEVQQARPSVLMSVDGVKLAEFSRAQQQRITLAQVSPHVVQALIATEDARFHQHRGVDVYRTLGAAWRTLMGDTQGGSTLTQQLARNLFPEEIGRSRTLTRKAKELVTAVRIERVFTKPQILELYLNTAPFLYNVVGIEMAARTYFDKPAAELDVLESATLIGMLKGTHYYNPIRYPDRALKRRNVVLTQMVRHGMLADAQFQALKDRPLTAQLNRQPDLMGDAPHFAMHLRKGLIAWADEHDLNLYTDGLVVQTTIDSRLQQAATQAVQRQADALQAVADVEWSAAGLRVQSGSAQAYAKARSRVQPFAHFWRQRPELLSAWLRERPEYPQALKQTGSEAAALQRLMADGALVQGLKQAKTRLEAGFLAMDPASGEVRAWVGSRGFAQDQFDHVAQAARQPGSTFKPFVYGAALESGISPDHSYLDEPIEFVLADRSVWRPTDMSEASYQGMPMREGLIQSKNTITAQVAHEVGVGRIVALARALGVDQSTLDAVPSLALGTSPVSLLEMVNAYASIAQLGEHHQPLMIRRISDRHGAVLAEYGSQTRRAMSEAAAVELIDMMRGAVDRGTGTQIRSRFGVVGDVAGKTGTTQNNTDGWFILMHPSLVAGAWVGFNDARVTMRSSHWGQGGHGALLLVGDFFQSVAKAGGLDAKAKFPPSRRPPPPPNPEPQSEGALQPLEPPEGPLMPRQAPPAVLEVGPLQPEAPAALDEPARVPILSAHTLSPAPSPPPSVDPVLRR
ncbi:penicillin-binding protein 1A [Aquabacterium sp.]|uniref:penicillin-binding protein 1A n=1 Tax=Aquabacterium sp. TaxID=1872578 RepID=UPI002C5E7F8B|nr:transglycosylase domain-containing protein [Aquabacterium sp.]HSW08480.1 transglycosylase domain-containing protein [Aquabacterium sp.]